MVKKVKAIPKVNTDLKTSQGMETFLNPSPSSTQKIDQKTNPQNSQPKINQSNFSIQKEQHKNETEQEQHEVKVNQSLNSLKEDLIEEIEEIEKKLQVRELEFSKFNELMYSHKLLCRVIMIRTRIYVQVFNKDTQKKVIVAIRLPKWGGSSLRYLINSCTLDWCEVTKKKTAKGEILSYSPVSNSDSDSDSDIEDIFD